VYLTIPSLRPYACKPVIFFLHEFNKFRDPLHSDYPHKHPSYSEFFFYDHPEKSTCRKAGGKSHIREGVVDILNDLAYGQKPNHGLKKPQKRGDGFSAIHDKHHPEGIDRDIAHPRQKYQQGHDKVRKDPLAYSH